MLDTEDPDSIHYRDRPVSLDDCKIKKLDAGERLMQALDDYKKDWLDIRAMIVNGKIPPKDGEEAMNRIQRIYENELKKILGKSSCN